MYDVRYIFQYDAFEFFESSIFQKIIHPLLLIGLFMMSGISQSFSKNNYKRLKKMIIIALGITLISVAVSIVFQKSFFVFWQIIHSLAFCIAVTLIIEKIFTTKNTQFIVLLILALLIIFVIPFVIEKFRLVQHGSFLLLPFGIGYRNPKVPPMIDYIPVVPLGGFFFIGVMLGKILYPNGKISQERFTGKIWYPLRFLGKYSLWVYALHQPILIFLIWVYGNVFL